MKFLFVHSWQGFSLAEWYLREAVSNCSCKVNFRTIDLPANEIPISDSLTRTIFNWKPDMIGFSCYFWNINLFLNTARWIKKASPDVKIILGGPQVNSNEYAARILSEHEHIDFIILGAGEEPLYSLINYINQEKDLSRIPNLLYKDNGEIRYNNFASRNKLKKKLIFHNHNYPLLNNSSFVSEISYETIKGCRSRCAYCYYPLESFQLIDDERVLAELSFICNLKVRNLRICDSHFGGTKERAKRILRHLKKVNSDTIVRIYPDIRHIDKEYIDLVKESGSRITSIGIQSTNMLSLKRIMREPIHHHKESINIILSNFPDVPADLIIGLPDDTIEGLTKTFKDVLGLGFCNINTFRLMLFPGTSMSDNIATYFNKNNFETTSSGQLIYSSDFPLDKQEQLSNLVLALEIACLFNSRQNTTSVNGSYVFELALKLNSDKLLALKDKTVSREFSFNELLLDITKN